MSTFPHPGAAVRGTARVLLSLALIGLPACDDADHGTHTIADVRVVPDRGARLFASSAQRFGISDEQESPDLFEYEVPSDFVELQPAKFREVNLQVPGDPPAECYVTLLSGGGEAANINRWRGQMSLGPLNAEEIAALPRRNFLGVKAPFVEIQGTFLGMGGGEGREGYTMLGLLATFPQAAVSVKMVGSAATVAAARDGFLAFADSLRIKGSSTSASAGSTGDPVQDSAAHPKAIQWDVPEGWEVGQGSKLRLVTLKVKDRPGVECWVTVLRGQAGGVAGNVNLWRKQMQQPPLTPEEIAGLPTVKVLGAEAPFLEVSGPETEDGKAPGLFGVIADLSGNSVFIKMIGLREDLVAERERFLSFCRSLRD